MHNIEYMSYDTAADKKDIFSEINSHVREESDCGGLYKDIQWYDREILDNFDAAMDFLNKNCRGTYDNLAVRYYTLTKRIGGKNLNTLKEKAEIARKKYENAERKIHYADAKSAYITCKECGSKLNRELLIKQPMPNKCPMCHHDLRPESTLKKIESLKENWKKAEDMERDLETRLAKQADMTNWLVRIEYHS